MTSNFVASGRITSCLLLDVLDVAKEFGHLVTSEKRLVEKIKETTQS